MIEIPVTLTFARESDLKAFLSSPIIDDTALEKIRETQLYVENYEAMQIVDDEIEKRMKGGGND